MRVPASQGEAGTRSLLMTMSEHTPTPISDGLGRGQRAGVLVVGLLLIVHSALVALWLAPPSPVRDLIGSSVLDTYVDPYFEQGTDMVGVGSNRVDEALSLRASVRPEGGGEPAVTRWIDVTAVDTQAIRGSVDPSRAHQVARRVAANLNFALFALNPEQRQIVADTGADAPVGQLERQLRSSGGNSSDSTNFLANDQMATQFASLWLGAALPDVELLQVQYRVGRRVVPQRAKHDAPALADIDYDWFSVGWRSTFRAEPEARAAFADHVGGVSSE